VIRPLALPDPALVLWAGVPETKPSERAAELFDAGDLAAPSDVRRRLREGRFTVVVVDDLDEGTVDPLLVFAKKSHSVVALVLLDAEPESRGGRHAARSLRQRRDVVGQRRLVQDVYTVAPGERVSVARTPLSFDRRDVEGPFDVIGDVHGCCDELEALLGKLGYGLKEGVWRHPSGRTAVFVGDLVDRGPGNLRVLERVMSMVDAGSGLCVLGNHDHKFLRWLGGGTPKLERGLKLTVDEFLGLPGAQQDALRTQAAGFFRGCPTHLILDGGALVVAHGGIREDLIGRSGGKVEAFTRFGDTTGETDADGYPVRLDWAADYTGTARIVYGHTPTLEPEWRNRTVNVDQGCVFGGSLTAVRIPELDFVQVRARRGYFEARRGLFAPDTPQGDL
jgi:protein phosphatase